jgi:hypothetical protein
LLRDRRCRLLGDSGARAASARGLVDAVPDAGGAALAGKRIQIDQIDLFEDVLELVTQQLRVFHR